MIDLELHCVVLAFTLFIKHNTKVYLNPNQSSSSTHIKIHPGKKSCFCQKWPKGFFFLTRDHLKAQEMINTGENIFL